MVATFGALAALEAAGLLRWWMTPLFVGSPYVGKRVLWGRW